MKRALFCISLLVCLPAIAADHGEAEGILRRHMVVEADYLPTKTAQHETITEGGDQETDQAKDFEGSASAGGSLAPPSAPQPFALNSADRESAQAGMSPEALRVLEMMKLGHDPSLAVSPHYVVAIEAHSVFFYDKKTGKRLTDTTGFPTALSSEGLFRPFMAKTLDGKYDPGTGRLTGTPNPTNLNNFAELPKGACDLTDSRKQYGCAYEVFDLRGIYDSQRGRFIFAGTSRRPRPNDNPNIVMNVDGRQYTVAREMTVIAVSRDEDPRNGFHEYLYTEGGDFPRIAVNDRAVTVTTWDGKLVIQFSADDLAKGVKSPAMARWNLYDKVKGPFSFPGIVYVVGERAPWSGYTWLVSERPGKDEFVTLWAIKGIGGKPTEVRIPIRNAGSHPLQSMRDWWTDPVLRNGRLYIASTDTMSARMVVRNGIDMATHKPPVFACRYYDEQWISLLENPSPAYRLAGQQIRAAGPCRIRLLGFTVNGAPNAFHGINDLDMDIGQAASDDPPGAIMSYILPAIDVTRRGAVVIAYMRTQYNKLPDPSKEISPEVRYSVYYPGEKAIRHSRLLHRGSGVDNHPNPSQKPLLRSGNYFGMDLARVDVDDEDVAWLSHGYSIGPAQFQEVIGAVRP